MMVSNAISENTLPAISKMLEQYILVYMQDDYMQTVNKGIFGKGPGPSLQYKFKGSKLIGENISLSEIPTPDYDYDVSAKDVKDYLKKDILPGTKEKAKSAGKEITQIGQKVKVFGQQAQALKQKYLTAKDSTIKVKTSDRIISIEPTYMTMETPYGTKLFGIKVVPYRVLSDSKLSALLMHDIQIKGITAATLPYGRAILGRIWRIAKMKGHVTGDPKQDIIYRTTGHRGETFVALEKNHDIDENFLKNTAKIKRLFKLGWGNFVICDDALQTAHFCLRATKGMCQAMSYRMMYKTFGQDQIYDDLEDVRKQNSSIFKISGKKFSKLIGEAKADGKLYNYQERQ